ncbi:glycosyl hydrolase family 8 [Caulobacter sp. NIBR2454]|uniref:glycosyl hydrolase family 8 n=1 Tax=Caulobacter sp. NIBR2454 TaxID=3015996 RepID=UPI0022B749DB|nr:glycosyl hydrolase family 8 [Caulobacter sp. NIBR2454]
MKTHALSNRRSLLAAAALAMILPGATACAEEGETWESFKARYMQPDGRIVDNGNGGVSHTEGQGWAMLLAEAFEDRETFEKVWTWTNANLARPDVRLFSWRYDPTAEPPLTDPNNATDGDIFIAWALLRASERWRSEDYARASAEIRGAIGRGLITQIAGRSVLLPGLEGFAGADGVTYNPSYFVLPALKAFAQMDPAGPWQATIAGGLELADLALFGQSALPSDWVFIGVDGRLAPAAGRPPRFGFDAIRAPLYLVWGGEKDRRQVRSIAALWRAGFKDDKRSPAWIDVMTGEVAPYPLSNGGAAVAALVLADVGIAKWRVEEPNYYSSVLQLLAAVARKDLGRKRIGL